MISKKQYLKSCNTVKEYEKQLRIDIVSRSFSEDDLWVLDGTIAVPSLTMDLVDEDYASKIESGLVEKGYSIDYVLLDDMGHISVRFYGGRYSVTISEKHIEDMLSVLNNV